MTTKVQTPPMTIPQVRVLRALKKVKGKSLTRMQLAERCGWSTGSGTINRALAGVKKNAIQAQHGSAAPHRGLVDLKYVEKRLYDDPADGIHETRYLLTKAGEHALETCGIKVPEVRKQRLSVNKRYTEKGGKE